MKLPILLVPSLLVGLGLELVLLVLLVVLVGLRLELVPLVLLVVTALFFPAASDLPMIPKFIFASASNSCEVLYY